MEHLSATQELDEAPGDNGTIITVTFEIDQAVFPIAQVSSTGSQVDDDDILLYDDEGNLLSATGTTYELNIDAGVGQGADDTTVFIELPTEEAGAEDDAGIEEFRINITALSSTDPVVDAQLMEGWHRQRLLVEDISTGNSAPPGTPNNTCNAICSYGCESYVIGSPNELVAQIGHATPWTSKDPITGCPETTSSLHCQESIKVRAEGPVGGHTLYMGYRFKLTDQQGEENQLCGCNLLTGASILRILFTISGSATPSDTPNAPEADDDYVLQYWTPNRNYYIPVLNYDPMGTTVEVDIKSGDYGNSGDCFFTRTPPGFGLRILTQPNMDTDDYEDIFISMSNTPQAPWIDGDTDDNFSIGWNNVGRFVIEEGQ